MLKNFNISIKSFAFAKCQRFPKTVHSVSAGGTADRTVKQKLLTTCRH